MKIYTEPRAVNKESFFRSDKNANAEELELILRLARLSSITLAAAHFLLASSTLDDAGEVANQPSAPSGCR
jgi:hypothetical protein